MEAHPSLRIGAIPSTETVVQVPPPSIETDSPYRFP